MEMNSCRGRRGSDYPMSYSILTFEHGKMMTVLLKCMFCRVTSNRRIIIPFWKRCIIHIKMQLLKYSNYGKTYAYGVMYLYIMVINSVMSSIFIYVSFYFV